MEELLWRHSQISLQKRKYLWKVHGQLLRACLAALLAHQMARVMQNRAMVELHAICQLCALPAVLSASCYFACSERSEANRRKRNVAFSVACFATGFILANLTHLANAINPEIVQTALVATLVVFVGFTTASLFADSSHLLGVYAALNVLGLYMLIVAVSSLFSTKFIHNYVTMFISILVEALYMYKFALEIVHRDSTLDKEPLDDAYMLFTSLVNLFSTILRELINKEQMERRRNVNNQRRRQRNADSD